MNVADRRREVVSAGRANIRYGMNGPHHILVTGAGGFIGTVVVRYLLRRGWKVRAMLRAPAVAQGQPTPLLEFVYADMRDGAALSKAVENADVVVHLAAAKNDERWSEEVNVGGAERLVRACRAAGCRRIVNVSTQSVKIARKGIYARTKSEADKIFENSGLAVTSLLPSVVFGDESGGVFATMARMIRKLPVVPVLGDGSWISAPVYVGDVAEAICRCIERNETIGKNYDIGGPDLIRFNELIDRVALSMGIRRRKLHVPFSISLLMARTLSLMLANPPITVSNVLGSNQDTRLDSAPARKDLEWEPMDFTTGLKLCLSNAPSTSARRTEPSDTELAAEGRRLARYLIGQDPPHELVCRYVAAHRTLFPDVPPSRDELDFVRRHPSTLPFIDAAAGLLKPESALRTRVLLMAAILETTPLYADHFLSMRRTPARLARVLVWNGIRATLRAALGIPVLWIATRS